jgi:hypothetical protein
MTANQVRNTCNKGNLDSHLESDDGILPKLVLSTSYYSFE